MGKVKHVEFCEENRHVAGIDLAGHARHYVCGPAQEDGSHEVADFDTTTRGLREMLSWLKARGVESVAMESTSVRWIPVADLLEAGGIKVLLVDAREVKMVPGRKSDVKDCQWLQKLHSCGLLRGAVRPAEDVGAVRTVLRECQSLVGMRVQCIQQIQKSLDQMNIRIHHAVTDLTGVTGMAILKAIVGGERDPLKLAKFRDRHCKNDEARIAEHLTGTWRREHLFILGRAYETLLHLDAQIKAYEGQAAAMLAALADKSGNPPAKPPARKLAAREKADMPKRLDLSRLAGGDLTSLPGIGCSTAAVIIAELGCDLSRFPDEKHFASYLGLAPTLGKSAGKDVRQKKRRRNTSRAGLALRQAASSLYHSKSWLGAYYRKVARTADKKAAVKATARKLAHLVYRMMVYGVQYVERGMAAFDASMREKRLRGVRNTVKSLQITADELKGALTVA